MWMWGCVRGGLIGTGCGKYISKETQDVLMSVFGLSAVANGVMSLIKGNTMPPVILALIVGVFAGQVLQLERRVKSGLGIALRKLPVSAEKINMDEYVTVVAIFCGKPDRGAPAGDLSGPVLSGQADRSPDHPKTP